MGVIKLAILLIVYTGIGALILMCVPGLPPDMKFEPYEVKTAAKLQGKLAPNAKLDRAEIVFDGEFFGPESIATRGDEVYTGVLGGHIIRLKNGKFEKIVRTGNECAGDWDVKNCGRPLGMRFEPSGKLIVADATKGLLRVDVDKKTVETLIPHNGKIDGSVPLNFADNVDIGKDGSIYFSDAVAKGTFGETLTSLIGEPSGRLMKYNPKTKKTEVLISGIRFANGVQLSRKEDFVAICETGLGRVLKYHLSGSKAGTHEVLVDGLPGYPDNIRSNGKGGFYIALVASRSDENPGIDNLGSKPWLRKIVVRLHYILVKLLSLLTQYAPHDYTGMLLSYAKHLGPFGQMSNFPKNVIIVEIDENGNILGSLQNKDAKLAFISEIEIGKEYSYLGSPFTQQLWRIKTEYI